MTLKEEFKTLREELSKKPDSKIVPTFIITGLEKLGYRTDDLEAPKPDGTVKIRGNEYSVFGEQGNFNKLFGAHQEVASILKSKSKLGEISYAWLYGLPATDDHELLAKQIFREKGIEMSFRDLKNDFKEGGNLIENLEGDNKKIAKQIFENPHDSFRIAVKGSYEINDSMFSGNIINAIDQENKPKRKVKP
ncbi:hypothetical protein FOM00_24930 [Pseudomonas sp. ST1]|uniref:hypothetical protein n=1 Tax=Pseudomonas TaxID=286 RepID=UPI0006B8DD83|nr:MULTISPECIES: hypothetical protein [Pseudomonas]KPY65378.1 Uncharacterized protein ALO58_00136 [Pseudomonas savastanoi pv. savastanoi]RML98081.1 hypothetical protein ALQ88_02571 [Pseudomonas savastanoi]TSC33316.1 hypothetical protein FOM00_24930 [Pseudomonas sp. ST1]